MARRQIVITIGVALATLAASGCSYLFRNGVSGAYSASGRPIVGFVQSGYPPELGRLSIGSREKEECTGEYTVTRKGVSVMGVALRDRIYRGKIYCLDGRQGEFEFVSPNKGQGGTMTGQIAGQDFSLRLVKPLEAESCHQDRCRWGIDWSEENQLSNGETYRKVIRNHEARQRSLKPEAVGPT